MRADAVLIDTSIAAHALGGPSKYQVPCRRVLAAAADAAGYASVEMVQELVHHRLRITGDRARAVADGRDVARFTTILPFDSEVLALSLDLVERFVTVRGRDAVHIATALVYGIERIASTDTDFDGIPGITRIDPLELYTPG